MRTRFQDRIKLHVDIFLFFFLLFFEDLIIGIDEKKFNDDESAEIVSFLERAFARLEAWFQWLYTSQKGNNMDAFKFLCYVFLAFTIFFL